MHRSRARHILRACRGAPLAYSNLKTWRSGVACDAYACVRVSTARRVGVQYDEPVGKNDGTVKGKRFFECPPKYGGFLRPDKLQVGDYPELDDLFTDDEDADDEGQGTAHAVEAS